MQHGNYASLGNMEITMPGPYLSWTREIENLFHINHKRSLREQNLRYGQSRAPLLFQYVKADTSIAVDIWMKYLSPKCNLQKQYGDRL